MSRFGFSFLNRLLFTARQSTVGLRQHLRRPPHHAAAVSGGGAPAAVRSLGEVAGQDVSGGIRVEGAGGPAGALPAWPFM